MGYYQSLFILTMVKRTIAPDNKRMMVKLEASMVFSPNAKRQSTELAAKAIREKPVKKNVFRMLWLDLIFSKVIIVTLLYLGGTSKCLLYWRKCYWSPRVPIVKSFSILLILLFTDIVKIKRQIKKLIILLSGSKFEISCPFSIYSKIEVKGINSPKISVIKQIIDSMRPTKDIYFGFNSIIPRHVKQKT